MTEIEKWNKWLKEKRSLHTMIEIDECYKDYIKEDFKTKEDIINYLAFINIIDPKLLYMQSKKDDASRIRGHLVKYVLVNNIAPFTSSNVVNLLFGLNRDHTSALRFKNSVEFTGVELAKYNQLCKYIETHNIIWI